MNKNIVKNAKRYILHLLRYDRRSPLYIICKDTCSEVSRLLGIWFRKRMPRANIYITKGVSKKLAHDLILIQEDEVIFIIDPTVWQFFKYKKSIFINKVKTIKEALDRLGDIYGGKWKISEHIIRYSQNDILKLQSILKKSTE